MDFTLGFSPCPNDTFIFDALVNGKIDCGSHNFNVVLEDVQTLNQWAIEGKLDISKISYGVLPLVTQHYKMLHSGGALGRGVGPLLISGSSILPTDPGFDINDYTVAIPGEHTTAHMLFSQAFPEARHKRFMVFHEIEDFLLGTAKEGNTLGVIIHENRFTYAQKGLFKLMDLGTYWEEATGFPIPLGGIAVKKTISPGIQFELERLITESIQYAFSNYPELPEYVSEHAREMEPAVMRRHIDLYVNDYSLHLGPKGEKAVEKFIDIFEQANPSIRTGNNFFI
ncbi:MAG: 1,4-dihydroxy-6-naphthoate synthase [Chitinophagaceae bacterium]|nr:1,4-dihydroxy-6-naphthoate synthase [Chitinophagaceae bacterium]MCW5928690.1 1,4-dihydroxy-6-naphthoate synthase [Chitinophagaceae bacterium]